MPFLDLVTTQFEQLKTLQQLDSRIYGLLDECQKKPLQVKQRQAELQQGRQQHQQLKERIKALRKKADQKELTLKEGEEKIRKLSVQLNTVRTNKEYSAILTEINSIKADNSVIEDEVLAILSQVDELQAEATEQQQKLHQREKELKQVEVQIENDLKELERQIEQLRNERQQLAEQIDPQLLTVYQRIVERTADHMAIAAEVDGVCQGCFMDLAPQEVNAIRGRTKVVICRCCSRILYSD
jgi:predicted  nucleic acid-binding Zn-ribbon protein